jgi:hypothetical protein
MQVTWRKQQRQGDERVMSALSRMVIANFDEAAENEMLGTGVVKDCSRSTGQTIHFDEKQEVVCEDCACSKSDPRFTGRMLLCSECISAHHQLCLDPPLKIIPPGDWTCPKCIAEATAAVHRT